MTEVTLQNDTVTYYCPKCGQTMIKGINGNKELSISYPSHVTEEEKTDHRHQYPMYINVEAFASRGIHVPAIELQQMMKTLGQSIITQLSKIGGK